MDPVSVQRQWIIAVAGLGSRERSRHIVEKAPGGPGEQGLPLGYLFTVECGE